MNEHSRVPRYVAIMEDVQSYIQENQLKPGDRIPTETEMMEQFGVSRATVRQAIQELVNEGAVEKRHGSGTFVAEPQLSVEINGFFSFYEEAAKRAGHSSTAIRRVELEDSPSDKVRRRLRLAPGEASVIVERVRSIDGDPVMLECTHLPASLFGGLTVADVEGRSIYDVFRDRGIRHVEGKERFRPYNPDLEIRKTLALDADVPVLRFSRLLQDDAGRYIEYTISYLKPGKLELTLPIDKAL